MSKKYIAVILLESSSDASNYRPMYEESYVEITALSEDDAQKKAIELAKSREASFDNKDGDKITWKFNQLVDIAESLDDSNGDIRELYSRHFHDIDAYKSMETLAR